MIKSTIALLAGALLLTSCTQTKEEPVTEDNTEMCVAGYVEDKPGKGTIDIFFPSKIVPPIQSIADVSVEVAQEITEQIGLCK